ncbi:hypothetical protein ACFY12_13770 [Streptomyces sp. NPDC001339]|uniref:hypothetical protein n=1 Tax=Streptomyces sp. NPDC001339 TaxID=3364563 RepID=UPI00369976BE
MSTSAWPWLCWRAEEAWNRHVRYRELYRRLDAARAVCKARAAWVDELTEPDMAAMRRHLAECIEAERTRHSGGVS